MLDRVLRWIFNREHAIEKILIFIIILGFLMLFKDIIFEFFTRHISDADSIINKILE